MVRALGILFAATAACAATLTDDRIAEVVKRLDTLSAKESPGPQADTRQRQSQLLRSLESGLVASPSTPNASSRISTTPRTCAMTAELPKLEFIEDAFAFIQTLAIADQRVPLAELLDCAEEFQVSPKLIESVARQFLHVVEHTTEAPADYERLSALRRRYELTVGGDNVSVRARDALAELAELVSTEYDFSLNLLNGNPVTLKQQRGKIVVLTFWATWCGPCITEMPLFERLYRTHGDHDLEVLAVTDDPAPTVAAFMKENGYTFPVALDPQRITFDHYRVPGMPAIIILDRTGRVRAESGAITSSELNHLLTIAGLPFTRSQLK